VVHLPRDAPIVHHCLPDPAINDSDPDQEWMNRQNRQLGRVA
jgi:hypothetical protein